MGKREENKEKQKNNILFTSLDLFVRKGYHGTTVRDIAKEANISVGLTFHYFPDKESILNELVSMASTGISSLSLILDSDLEPLKIFKEVTKTVLKSFEDPLAYKIFLLVSQILTLESIPEAIKEKINPRNNINKSVPIIEKGQDDGDFKDGNPLAIAITYWGALQGLAETLYIIPDSPLPKVGFIMDILK